MRRFEQRTTETLVLRRAARPHRHVRARRRRGRAAEDAVVEDVAIEQARPREWVRQGLRPPGPGAVRLPGVCGCRRRRGETLLVDIARRHRAARRDGRQGAERLLATYDDLKAADLAEVIHELIPKRRVEVAAALDDERLADVLEELPEDDQVEILTGLGAERAADVLEAMQPDDAADLLSELPPEQAEQLLQLMEPDEAAPLRRLLAYDEKTAGGMMTTEPVILAPEATIAEALALVRRAELAPALADRRLRLPAAAGDAHRRGTSASSTSSGCCASRRTAPSAR